MRTLEEVPEGATHWSKRELAKRVGISPTSVHRIWRSFGLQPWRTQDFKISPDPLLIDKIRDVVGLYLAPPERAVVLCVDEKTGIQALNRTQPGLPLRAHKPGAWTNEYVRHGTQTLLAALEIATGKVVAHVRNRRTSVNFLRFMNDVVRAYPNRELHVVVDNLNIHKNEAAQRWLVLVQREMEKSTLSVSEYSASLGWAEARPIHNVDRHEEAGTEAATGFKRRSGWATIVHLVHRTQTSLRSVRAVGWA